MFEGMNKSCDLMLFVYCHELSNTSSTDMSLRFEKTKKQCQNIERSTLHDSHPGFGLLFRKD